MTKEDVTRRFCECCDRLVAAQIVQNKTQFCKALNIVVSNYNLMVKGERFVTTEQACALFSFFYISPDWLFGVSEDMYHFRRTN